MDGKDLLSTGNVFWGYRKMMRIKAEKLTEVNGGATTITMPKFSLV